MISEKLSKEIENFVARYANKRMIQSLEIRKDLSREEKDALITEEKKSMLSELVSDVMHFADANEIDPSEVIEEARIMYQDDYSVHGMICSDKELDGDFALGHWDGKDINDLLEILAKINTQRPERIIDYENLPFNSRVPDDLTDYPVWTMDSQNQCLVGDAADQVKPLDEVRAERQELENELGCCPR